MFYTLNFIKNYVWETLISIIFLSVFAFYTISGDLFCACSKTDTYKASSNGGHGSSYSGRHYYHK